MKIFILEDDMNRIVKFEKILYDHDLTIVSVAQEAIQLLRNEKYDYLFLDHDLAEGNGNGMEVAREIPYTNNLNVPCVIHSVNPVAAKQMLWEIPDSKHIPFTHLIDDLRFCICNN